MILTRRTILLATVGFALSNTGQVIMAAPKFPDVVAYRNPGCSCCENWAKLMEKAGFKITMSDDPDLAATRKSLGIPESVAGCHFAQVGRYIIEGHVPVEDILRLLGEQSDAMGLAVPGMPTGSPGMETEGKAEKYSVLIFEADGTSKIYSQH